MVNMDAAIEFTREEQLERYAKGADPCEVVIFQSYRVGSLDNTPPLFGMLFGNPEHNVYLMAPTDEGAHVSEKYCRQHGILLDDSDPWVLVMDKASKQPPRLVPRPVKELAWCGVG